MRRAGFSQSNALLAIHARRPGASKAAPPTCVLSTDHDFLSRSEKSGFRIDSPPLLLAAHYLPPPLPAC